MKTLSLFLGLGVPIFAATVAPVGAGYFATDSTATFVSIVGNGGTVLPGSSADDVVVGFTLPFDISLYGTTHASGATLTASTNGNIQFRASGGSTTLTNQDLGAVSLITSTAVFPYWDDVILTTPGGGIYTHTTGAMGSRRFVVEWLGRRFGDGSTTSNVNVQAVFFEGSTDFVFNYGMTGIGIALDGLSATVGARQDSSNYTQWSLNSAALSPNLSIRFSLTDPNPSSVPEPSSAALVLVAAAGFGLRRRLKK